MGGNFHDQRLYSECAGSHLELPLGHFSSGCARLIENALHADAGQSEKTAPPRPRASGKGKGKGRAIMEVPFFPIDPLTLPVLRLIQMNLNLATGSWQLILTRNVQKRQPRALL